MLLPWAGHCGGNGAIAKLAAVPLEKTSHLRG